MANNSRLEVRFRRRLGSLDLQIEFVSHAPWTILFGPSGSGKSSVLRAIAGLSRPDSGKIVLGDTVVFDSIRRVDVPTHERKMRWAPQRAMLFPRLSIRANLALGIAGPGAAETLENLLRHFKLLELADCFPDELSGGQRQRISVIRAAAGLRDSLLLLDEPFAGLDAAVRDRLAVDLRTWRGSAPVLSVTHDVGEAFLLGADVIRLAEGRVLEQGPVEDTLAQDRLNLVKILGERPR